MRITNWATSTSTSEGEGKKSGKTCPLRKEKRGKRKRGKKEGAVFIRLLPLRLQYLSDPEGGLLREKRKKNMKGMDPP